MSELPDEWRAYARLQNSLSHTYREDNRSRAMEVALTGALIALGQGADVTADDLQRTERSAARRERNRTRLRLIWANGHDCVTDPEPGLTSHFELQSARACVAERDWDLLLRVGLGHAYEEL